MNSFNLELQLKNTEFAIKSKLKSLLNELKRFQFVIILVLKLKKKQPTKCSTSYSNSKAKTVIYDTDIDNVFESIYSTVMKKKYENIWQKTHIMHY